MHAFEAKTEEEDGEKEERRRRRSIEEEEEEKKKEERKEMKGRREGRKRIFIFEGNTQRWKEIKVYLFYFLFFCGC